MSNDTLAAIPLSQSYLCQDCNCIGNRSTHCAYCQSQALMNLATVLERDSKDSQADGVKVLAWA